MLENSSTSSPCDRCHLDLARFRESWGQLKSILDTIRIVAHKKKTTKFQIKFFIKTKKKTVRKYFRVRTNF